MGRHGDRGARGEIAARRRRVDLVRDGDRRREVERLGSAILRHVEPVVRRLPLPGEARGDSFVHVGVRGPRVGDGRPPGAAAVRRGLERVAGRHIADAVLVERIGGRADDRSAACGALHTRWRCREADVLRIVCDDELPRLGRLSVEAIAVDGVVRGDFGGGKHTAVDADAFNFPLPPAVGSPLAHVTDVDALNTARGGAFRRSTPDSNTIFIEGHGLGRCVESHRARGENGVCICLKV